MIGCCGHNLASWHRMCQGAGASVPGHFALCVRFTVRDARLANPSQMCCVCHDAGKKSQLLKCSVHGQDISPLPPLPHVVQKPVLTGGRGH